MHVRPGPFFPNNFLEYSGLPSKQTCALINPGFFLSFRSFPQSYWIFETWCNGKILNWFRTMDKFSFTVHLLGPVRLFETPWYLFTVHWHFFARKFDNMASYCILLPKLYISRTIETQMNLSPLFFVTFLSCQFLQFC